MATNEEKVSDEMLREMLEAQDAAEAAELKRQYNIDPTMLQEMEDALRTQAHIEQGGTAAGPGMMSAPNMMQLPQGMPDGQQFSMYPPVQEEPLFLPASVADILQRELMLMQRKSMLARTAAENDKLRIDRGLLEVRAAKVNYNLLATPPARQKFTELQETNKKIQTARENLRAKFDEKSAKELVELLDKRDQTLAKINADFRGLYLDCSPYVNQATTRGDGKARAGRATGGSVFTPSATAPIFKPSATASVFTPNAARRVAKPEKPAPSKAPIGGVNDESGTKGTIAW